MVPLLVVLTVLEILVFAAVLVAYLIRISRSLRRTSESLGKVTFGVRAIETQTAAVGPSVTRINGQLHQIATALDELADRAERTGRAGGAGAGGAGTVGGT